MFIQFQASKVMELAKQTLFFDKINVYLFFGLKI